MASETAGHVQLVALFWADLTSLGADIKSKGVSEYRWGNSSRGRGIFFFNSSWKIEKNKDE